MYAVNDLLTLETPHFFEGQMAIVDDPSQGYFGSYGIVDGYQGDWEGVEKAYWIHFPYSTEYAIVAERNMSVMPAAANVGFTYDPYDYMYAVPDGLEAVAMKTKLG